jgi:hypothetical protein
MDWWYFFLSIFFVSVTADIGRVHTLNIQQDERVRLECTLTSKKDAEEVNMKLSFMETDSRNFAIMTLAVDF